MKYTLMKKLRIYLDTSVINFVFADETPELMRITRDFFERYASRYELFVSEIVLDELERTPDRVRRDAMLQLLTAQHVTILPIDTRTDVKCLAGRYMACGIVPAAKIADALHVAYAVICEMDIILSWNFKHLANVRKEAQFASVNLEQGYTRPLRLVSPLEVEYEED